MKKNLIILLLIICVCSCNNKNSSEEPAKKQLDSLLGFGQIIAIYSHGGRPPLIKDDVLEENESPQPLYTDSIYRWTDSPKIINSIRGLFPKLRKYTGVIETTCCGQREILINTGSRTYQFSWNSNTSDSAVFMNSIVYGADKKAMNTIYELLDRKIITKEIYLKDTLTYHVQDIYNETYLNNGSETRLVYILR